jgi:hypothetical protein
MNRTIWVVCALLTLMVRVGVVVPAVRLRPYWVADAHGTDLRHTNVHDSVWAGARYDARSRWSAGFDPRRHGAVLLK